MSKFINEEIMLDFFTQIGAMASSIGCIGSCALCLIDLYVLFCMKMAGEDFYKEKIEKGERLLKGLLIFCVVSTVLMIIFFYIIREIS